MIPIFDEWLSGSAARPMWWSTDGLARRLASPEIVTLQAVFQVGGSLPTAFEIFLEHTSDGSHFQSKYQDSLGNPIAIVSPVLAGLSLNATNAVTGAEPWPPKPTGRFARLRIHYQGGRTRLLVYLVGRQRRRHEKRDMDCGCHGCVGCKPACACAHGGPDHLLDHLEPGARRAIKGGLHAMNGGRSARDMQRAMARIAAVEPSVIEPLNHAAGRAAMAILLGG